MEEWACLDPAMGGDPIGTGMSRERLSAILFSPADPDNLCLSPWCAQAPKAKLPYPCGCSKWPRTRSRMLESGARPCNTSRCCICSASSRCCTKTFVARLRRQWRFRYDEMRDSMAWVTTAFGGMSRFPCLLVSWWRLLLSVPRMHQEK